MEARLALRDEADAGLARVRVGDEAAVHGRAAHLGLLGALPAVRVAEHELQVVLDRAPHRAAVRVGVDDEAARAAKEVAEKVAKDVHGALAAREGGEAHAVHLERHRLWAEAQLEPVRRWGVRSVGLLERAAVGDDAQFCLEPAVVLCEVCHCGGVCLCARGGHLAVFVVVHEGGDLGVARDVLLARKSVAVDVAGGSERRRGAVRGGGERNAPGDAVYFGDLAGLEDGVGDAAEGCAEIESEDEGARGPAIGLASVARERHGGYGYRLGGQQTEIKDAGGQ